MRTKFWFEISREIEIRCFGKIQCERCLMDTAVSGLDLLAKFC
jgi:hypothetical protein